MSGTLNYLHSLVCGSQSHILCTVCVHVEIHIYTSSRNVSVTVVQPQAGICAQVLLKLKMF
jgi:hypothetical protein